MCLSLFHVKVVRRFYLKGMCLAGDLENAQANFYPYVPTGLESNPIFLQECVYVRTKYKIEYS